MTDLVLEEYRGIQENRGSLQRPAISWRCWSLSTALKGKSAGKGEIQEEQSEGGVGGGSVLPELKEDTSKFKRGLHHTGTKWRLASW